MKRLDRYIIRKYLSTFIFTCLLFSAVAVAIDFSEKLEDYREPTWQEVIFDYYVNFLPFINWQLFPIYTLITVIFFTGRLANNSEIIAILNAGVSFRRLAVPYMLCAAVIATVHFYGNHRWVPNANKTRVHFENTYVWKNNFESRTTNIHRYIRPQEKIYIQRFSTVDSSARYFSVERFEEQDLVYRLVASSARWNEDEKAWYLNNVVERTWNEMNETMAHSRSMTLEIPLGPGDLIRRDNLRETMTTSELLAFIEQEELRGAGNLEGFWVERYRRTSDAFMVFILTMIGLSIASRKVRGGMGVHLAIGFALGGLYVFISRFSHVFATMGGLDPAIGVWLPNILFIGVVIALMFKAQK